MTAIEIKSSEIATTAAPKVMTPTVTAPQNLCSAEVNGNKAQFRAALATIPETSTAPLNPPSHLNNCHSSQQPLAPSTNQQHHSHSAPDFAAIRTTPASVTTSDASASKLNEALQNQQQPQSERISLLISNLSGREQGQITAIADSYQRQSGRSLSDDVKNLPNGQNISKFVESALSGDKVSAEAQAIRLSAKLNEGEICRAFSDPKVERSTLNSDLVGNRFKELYGETISQFTSRELSTSKENILKLALAGEVNAVNGAVQLREVLQRFSRNPEGSLHELMTLIKERGPELSQQYREIFGSSIGADRSIFAISNIREALGILVGVDKVSGVVSLINSAIAGKIDLLGLATGIALSMNGSEKLMLSERFKEILGHDIRDMIQGLNQISGREKDLIIRLLTEPKIEPMDLLMRECLRRPPSAERISAIFSGNSPDRNESMVQNLSEKHGIKFENLVNSKLRGSDQLDVILAQRGAPRTAEEIVQRLLIHHSYDRANKNDVVVKISNEVARIGERYDRDVSKIEEIYYTRRLSDGDSHQITQLGRLVDKDRTLFRAARHRIAKVISKFIGGLTVVISFLIILALQGSSGSDLALAGLVSLFSGYIAYHISHSVLHRETFMQKDLKSNQLKGRKELLRARGTLFPI